MEAKGIVRKIEGETAVVEIKRKPACSGCSKECGGCIGGGDDVISVRIENTRGAAEGDVVTLEASDTRLLGYAAAVFIAPLAAGLGLYFLAHWLSHGNPAISYGVSAAGFISAVLLIYKTLNRAAGENGFKMK